LRTRPIPASGAEDAIYSPTLWDAVEAYESGLNRGFAPERALRHAAASLARTDSLSDEKAIALLRAAIERQVRARQAVRAAALHARADDES
jgi:hypothetical protein